MKPSSVRVAEANAEAVARYKEMRAALMESPGIDRRLCEIVITTQLALLGNENAFKIHAMRLFELQVSRKELEQVILAGIGVTFLLPHAARALEWIEEADGRYRATPRA